MKNQDLILVSNWEKVPTDDYYLSADWQTSNGESDETMAEANKLAKQGQLYYGYIVPAVSYAIFKQMDSNQVLINDDGEVIINCETAIIDNQHEHREEFNY